MILHGDCLDVLPGIASDSIDALVTDPPAGISFMGKSWDSDKGGRKEWIAWLESVMRECIRVMKPGAHGLIWAIPRTSHWTATALEDAGFEIRDVVTHLFGQGFPKSLDISKAIDKAAGAEREVVCSFEKKDSHAEWACGNGNPRTHHNLGKTSVKVKITAAATPAAKEWSGWGTALKPACEHWIMVRKPCSEKTVAANVLKWGVGGLNIDASRISFDAAAAAAAAAAQASGMLHLQHSDKQSTKMGGAKPGDIIEMYKPGGRFPANLVLSHSQYCADDQCDIECPVRTLDEQTASLHSAGYAKPRGKEFNGDKSIFGIGLKDSARIGDSGGASRFFYCAKISSFERNAGCEEFELKKFEVGDERPSGNSWERRGRKSGVQRNTHPTVKPKKLMGYLIKLVTPPGGMVLDPFMGSGSTGIAAKECGFEFIGIEREKEYVEIANARIAAVT